MKKESQINKSAAARAAQLSELYSNYYDDLIESRKNLIIKLKYPQPTQLIEIYDLELLQIDKSSSSTPPGATAAPPAHSVSSSLSSSLAPSTSSSSSTSAAYSANSFKFRPSTSPSSVSTSSSSSSYSTRASFDSNDLKFSINEHFSSPPSMSKHLLTVDDDKQKPKTNVKNTHPKLYRNNASRDDDDYAAYHCDNDAEYTFKDFVSSVINNANEDLHVLIVEDIGRLLELKFRDFKKYALKCNLFAQQPGETVKAAENSAIFLKSDCSLFTQIGAQIFKLALEEPNGILGARLRLRFQLLDGRVYDCCDSFAYDATTMPTSELVVTLREQCTETRKLLGRFRILSALEKYLWRHVDPSNYEIIKNRLY
jgi:hypothetical protein